jgi:large subunit ribosomal protein L18
MPNGIKVETPTQTEILIKGIDKQVVGQVAAEVRAYRSPSPTRARVFAMPTKWLPSKKPRRNNRGAESWKRNRLVCAGRAKPAPRLRSSKSVRLAVHRSNLHIYAQIFSGCGTRVMLPRRPWKRCVPGSERRQCQAAKTVGKFIAERAKAAGIEQVAFDRSGFHYHGRVKALAEAAREGGLKF